MGDRIELQQVLLNLIANAIDAMERVPLESRRIDISSASTGDQFVQVTVTDQGTGLHGVDMERMFTLSYTTKDAGTGVGLSVSRSIVEAHGGKLWAEQNPGRGSNVLLHSPRVTPVSPCAPDATRRDARTSCSSSAVRCGIRATGCSSPPTSASP